MKRRPDPLISEAMRRLSRRRKPNQRKGGRPRIMLPCPRGCGRLVTATQARTPLKSHPCTA